MPRVVPHPVEGDVARLRQGGAVAVARRVEEDVDPLEPGEDPAKRLRVVGIRRPVDRRRELRRMPLDREDPAPRLRDLGARIMRPPADRQVGRRTRGMLERPPGREQAARRARRRDRIRRARAGARPAAVEEQ